MAVYFAAAACLVFYICAVPLKLAFVIESQPQLKLRAGAAPFENRFALRRAGKEQKKKKRRLRMPPAAAIPPALKAGRYILRRIHLEYLRAEGAVSAPDAARTALICGMANSIQAACAPMGGRVQIDLFPDFTSETSCISAAGMMRLRLGHIIIAALIFLIHYLKERFKTWTTDIPSKILCRPPWKTFATWWT